MNSRRVFDLDFLRTAMLGVNQPRKTLPLKLSKAASIAGKILTSDTYPERLSQAAQGMQQPVSTGRRIAVISSRGGTGASTLSQMVAESLNAMRRDVIGLIDLNNLASGLQARRGALSPQELLETLNMKTPESREDFLDATHTPTGHVVTASSQGYEKPLSAEATALLIAEFSRYSAATIIECPPGTDDARTLTALSTAHVAMIVTEATQQGFQGAWELAHCVKNLPENANLPLLVVANQRNSAPSEKLNQVRQYMQGAGHPVGTVRFSRELLEGNRGLDKLPEASAMDFFQVASKAMSLSRLKDQAS